MLSRAVLAFLVLLVLGESVLVLVESSIVSRTGSLVVVIVGTAAVVSTLQSWRTQRLLSTIGDSLKLVPVKIAISRDDDGHATAIVERVDAEPVVLRIPDDVAEHGPEAIMPWIAEQLLLDVE